MTAKKRVVKKSASKKPVSNRSPDHLQSPEANDAVIENGGDTSKGPAKQVSKVVNLIISIDDSDRGRSWEKFVEDIKRQTKAVGPPYIDDDNNRIPGPHVTITGGYYILDGKVCKPEDYDPKKQRFKPGATPPPWAGGPKHSTVALSSSQKQMEWDREHLSSDEYDQKYQIGKYKPVVDYSKVITPAQQKEKMKEWKRDKELREEAELEDFEWDESDALDDAKMGKVADKSASAAAKKLKGGKKKRVVKKPAKKTASKTTKKVVRRVKK